MDWLEQELKSALARKDPPAGFAEEVVRQAGEESAADGPARRAKVLAWPVRKTHRWLAAAAAVVLLAAGGWGYRWHEGMVAKRQVMQAFLIAGGQLNHLQAHIKEVSQ